MFLATVLAAALVKVLRARSKPQTRRAHARRRDVDDIGQVSTRATRRLVGDRRKRSASLANT